MLIFSFFKKYFVLFLDGPAYRNLVQNLNPSKKDSR